MRRAADLAYWKPLFPSLFSCLDRPRKARYDSVGLDSLSGFLFA